MTTADKPLRAVFTIPKKNFKSSNMALGHIVAAQKSAWIRQYAGPVWEAAVLEQFGITAIEPTEDQLDKVPVTDEVQKVLDQVKDLEAEILEVTNERKEYEDRADQHKTAKADLRGLKRLKNDPESASKIVEKELEIAEYETALDSLKASQKRLKATLQAVKRRHGKEITKELRRVNNAERRNYLAKKLELNSHQQLFTECAVVVTAHNISKHLFDAPNFYPTVKPILDGATDAGVVWEDDNNTVITGGVLFQSGEHLSRDNYIIEIEVVPVWPWKDKYVPLKNSASTG